VSWHTFSLSLPPHHYPAHPPFSLHPYQKKSRVSEYPNWWIIMSCLLLKSRSKIDTKGSLFPLRQIPKTQCLSLFFISLRFLSPFSFLALAQNQTFIQSPKAAGRIPSFSISLFSPFFSGCIYFPLSLFLSLSLFIFFTKSTR